MALTPLDTVEDPLPSPTRPSTFNDDMDRFINTKLPRLADEVDDVATAFTLNATNSTSTSSVSIGTGTKNYTVQTGKSYVKGMFVIAADNAAPSANYNYGQVLSYDSGTGALSIDVTNAPGSGTKTSWVISQTSPGGVTTAGATFSGDILVPDEAYDATAWNASLEVPTKNAVRDKIESIVFRSYLAGLTLSTAGSSTTMSVAAGQAADSTNAVAITLASAISKTTSAWAVGSTNGGLDTGTIANSTWYYFYLIRRPDTGVVDVIFSLSASSPTLPTNYTQYRYIGGAKTNGSAQWTLFVQDGDDFYWDTPVVDFTGAGSTTATTTTLTVPRKRVKAYLNVQLQNAVAYISDLTNSNLAPTTDSATNPLASVGGAAGNAFLSGQVSVWTNTSAQIRRRESTTSTAGYVTLGWRDTRGKDA